MKALIASTLMALAPGLVLAQTPAPAAKPEAKPEAKRPLPRSTLKAVEENTPIDEDTSVTLTPADIEVAKRVYVGEIPCELGASINIAPARREGFFLVRTKDMRFYMHPVESRTGAIRLEDPKRGAMWLQLGNKSMLMNQRLGQRIADECVTPAQRDFALQMKTSNQPGLLDGPSK